MATRIKLSDLERRILDRVVLSNDGFERIEELLAAIGGDRNQFVDALETLEGEGYVSVSNLGGDIVVACEDVLALVGSGTIYSGRVGHC
jgi:hypothetical protein